MNGARMGGGGGRGRRERTSWAVFIDINVGLITAARPAIMPLCSTCSHLPTAVGASVTWLPLPGAPNIEMWK